MIIPLRWTCIAAAMAVSMISGGAHGAEARYQCSDGARLTARFSPPGAKNSHVELIFDKSRRRISLPQVASADGGRYADHGFEFWIKGGNATLTRDGASETCATK